MRRCRNRLPVQMRGNRCRCSCTTVSPRRRRRSNGRRTASVYGGHAEGETWTCLLYRCFDNGMSRT